MRSMGDKNGKEPRDVFLNKHIIMAAKSTKDYSVQSKRNYLTVSFFSPLPGQ